MDVNEIFTEIEEIRKQDYSEYVTVKDVRIRYFAYGSGPPVVLLHGFGSMLESWALNIPPLSQNYRTYAVDLPGHGLSSSSDNCYKSANITDYTAAIMDAIGIERASFIGHSLGGLVSLKFALKAPDRVDKLILIDSAGLSPKMPLAYRVASMPVLGKAFMKAAARLAFARSMRRIFNNSDVLSEDMLDMFLKDFHQDRIEDSLSRILRQNVSLKGPNQDIVMVESLARVKSPTLFVHGGRDSVFPLNQVRETFNMVPDARVKIFDECGHCPHVERVLDYNKLAISFLSAV